DGADRRAGVAHGAPRALHPAHQRRGERRDTPRGHRGRGVQDRGGVARRGGAAADAQALPHVQGSLDGSAARPAEAVDSQRDAAAEPVPAPGGRRPSSGMPASRGTPAPPAGTFAAPPATSPVEPLAAHFDLLEEPPRPRVSGPHGELAVKVLLVDDEDSLRKVMRDLLERDGYSVSEARDGVQALDQIDRVGPDIIVLDLNLPGLDGYGVLSHLRSRPATASIPVIVLTAKGDER